jgi:hypothetical protein
MFPAQDVAREDRHERSSWAMKDIRRWERKGVCPAMDTTARRPQLKRVLKSMSRSSLATKISKTNMLKILPAEKGNLLTTNPDNLCDHASTMGFLALWFVHSLMQ